MKIIKLNKKGMLIQPPISKKLKAGLVILKEGEEVGDHVTSNKEELIIVLEGTAQVIFDGKKRNVAENNLIFIPTNKKHNVKNNYTGELKYIYVVGLFGFSS